VQLRVSVGVEETDGDKAGVVSPVATVANRKGASGLERGTRFLRGEDSEEENLRNGCGMKQGHEARVC
jgi:hypothetical protein